RHTRSKRDWSSDVCSSDLLIDDLPEGDQLHRRFARQTGHPQKPGTPGQGSELERRGPTELRPAAEPGSAQPLNSVAIMSGREIEIGRASCRERVWSTAAVA